MSETAPWIYADTGALAQAAASELTRLAQESVAARGLFTLSLAGGSTPKKLYSLLATDPAFRGIPWAKTHLFFGDERHVPPDDPDSNYRMVRTTLLSSGLVPEANVHRMQAELPDAAEAASTYDAEMHAFFGDDLRRNGFPRFDLILLGMGPDGHTASLFPGSHGLEEKSRWVIANPVEKFKTDRITFTFPVLNAARALYLLVVGTDKADMIREVLGPDQNHPPYPVQRVAPADGVKIWMLDDAAAAKLPPESLRR
jgi:6-phosphogluconolactonase